LSRLKCSQVLYKAAPAATNKVILPKGEVKAFIKASPNTLALFIPVLRKTWKGLKLLLTKFLSKTSSNAPPVSSLKLEIIFKNSSALVLFSSP